MRTLILVFLVSGCSITSGFDDYTFEPDADTDTGFAGMGGSDAYVEAGTSGKDSRDAEPEPDTGIPDTGVPDTSTPDTGTPEPLAWCDTCQRDGDPCGDGLTCVKVRLTWTCQVQCECVRPHGPCGVPCQEPGERCLQTGDYYTNTQGVAINYGVCATDDFIDPDTAGWEMPRLNLSLMESTCNE